MRSEDIVVRNIYEQNNPTLHWHFRENGISGHKSEFIPCCGRDVRKERPKRWPDIIKKGNENIKRCPGEVTGYVQQESLTQCPCDRWRPGHSKFPSACVRKAIHHDKWGNDYRSSWHNLWICWFLDKYKINFLVLVEIFGAPINQVLLCFISGWYIQDHFRVSFSDTLKELGVTVLESILFFFGKWTLYQVIANFYKRIYSLYYMIVMAEQIIHKSVLGKIWCLFIDHPASFIVWNFDPVIFMYSSFVPFYFLLMKNTF